MQISESSSTSGELEGCKLTRAISESASYSNTSKLYSLYGSVYAPSPPLTNEAVSTRCFVRWPRSLVWTHLVSFRLSVEACSGMP